jgi:hypothetical protein
MCPAARFSVPPTRSLCAWAVVLGGVAGCYNPSLQEGSPCANSDQCPDTQRCVLGSCSFREAPPIDARPAVPPDAMADAPPPIDAMPPACSTTGLSCGGGSVTMFTCGGHCWVKCTAGVARDMARSACAGWTGALGEIDDATEQGCVTPHVGTSPLAPAFWIGAIQSNPAATPSDGWTWNGTTPMVYTNWAAGKPDDADGVENGMEQCATIRSDGTWDDDTCSTGWGFFCERP